MFNDKQINIVSYKLRVSSINIIRYTVLSCDLLDSVQFINVRQ